MPTFHLGVVAGPGLVARIGDGVLVAGDDPSHSALLDALLDALTELCGDRSDPAPGDALAVRLARVRQDHPADPLPHFAALAPGRAGAVVVLGPGVRVGWGRGERMERPPDAVDHREQLVPWEAGQVTIALATAADATERPAPRTDLVAGIVPGAGAMVVWSEPASEAPAPEVLAPPEALPEPELRPAPFEVIDLGVPSDVEPRAPLPMPSREEPAPVSVAVSISAPGVDAPLVDGIRCVRNHFNHPGARYCAICGIDFHQRTIEVVKGPRPPLGILIFDDGAAYTLDTGYIVGREPELDPDVVARRARPLVLPDPQRYIGRVHADLRLEGWEVILTDRGSANGTFVFAPGSTGWARVTPRQPVFVPPGTQVAIGPRSFVYESHHVPS